MICFTNCHSEHSENVYFGMKGVPDHKFGKRNFVGRLRLLDDEC